MDIRKLAQGLYRKRPGGTLYHYTSLTGAMGIVENRTLHVTATRFLNDAAEIRYTVNLLLDRARSFSPRLEREWSVWLSEHLLGTRMRFVACLTANGNLLSQWRSYCPPTKGVSLGFAATKLTASVKDQSCLLGKCIYDPKVHSRIAKTISEQIKHRAMTTIPNKDSWEEYDQGKYTAIFEESADDLLRIAALLKHPSFHEEQEWRIISPSIPTDGETPISYREGSSNLVPYMNFQLPKTVDGLLDLEHVILGPTQNPGNSVSSFSHYLSAKRASPKRGTNYCRIPYRSW